MSDSEACETYKYFVVSYRESASPYHSKYRSDNGHSSSFATGRFYDEEEVKEHIYILELNKCVNEYYIRMDYFRYDHYIYTPENLFGPTYDEYGNYIDYDGYELPKVWQEEIMGRVNDELNRIQAEKEAKALEEKRRLDIMKEQEERQLYEKLHNKFNGAPQV
jgi:hypothetical protein